MSVIFPGNYVAHLNAYRDQGVYAIPGIEFYQVVGAALLSEETAAGTLNPEIQSPDLRQDDKPRLNKPVTVPAGAIVYRTAISTSKPGDHWHQHCCCRWLDHRWSGSFSGCC